MVQSLSHATLPESAVEAHSLVKVYRGRGGDKRALDGVSLSVPRGSFFGLLGPNGAGKSTFINILAGLVLKSEGRVTIWDRDIDLDARGAKAAIGVVPCVVLGGAAAIVAALAWAVLVPALRRADRFEQ